MIGSEFCGTETERSFSSVKGRNMILKDIWMDVKRFRSAIRLRKKCIGGTTLYQGVHALIWHRVAHWFYEHHMFFIARLISGGGTFLYID